MTNDHKHDLFANENLEKSNFYTKSTLHFLSSLNCQLQWNLDLRKPNLRKNLDLRKIIATTNFLVHKLFDP